MVAVAAGEASGAVGWGGGMVVVMGSEVEVVAGDEDMIEQGQSDTKLIGAGILPDLDRRLYGWKGGWRGAGRARRRVGAVIARDEAVAARVPTPQGVGQQIMIYCLIDTERLHEFI